MATCIICGQAHRACGPRTTVVAVDQNMRKVDGTMSDLKRYDVVIPGRAEHTTTLLLSDADAKAQGLTEKDLAGKAKPANKAAKPAANKARGATAGSGPKTKSVESEPVSVSDPGALPASQAGDEK